MNQRKNILKIYEEIDNEGKEKKGKVCDLVVPVITLIICCIIGMIYTGGFFSGTDFVTAFSNSDASVGLALGSIFALVITLVFYVVRRILPFNECMDCLPEGFKAMVPAILILTFAWTLKNMTSSLGAAEFVEVIMKNSAEGFAIFLPAVIFVVGCGLAFATGTSWGTFGILIPISVTILSANYMMMSVCVGAILAGAVCGDHISPISDTTILSSAGAQCRHIDHVATQMPYALTVALCASVGYILSGITGNGYIGLAGAAISLALAMMIIVITAKRGR